MQHVFSALFAPSHVLSFLPDPHQACGSPTGEKLWLCCVNLACYHNRGSAIVDSCFLGGRQASVG